MRSVLLFAGAAIWCARGAEIRSRVTDPSGAPVPSARAVFATSRGIVTETVTDASGSFRLEVPGGLGGRIVVTAPGFATALFPENGLPATIALQLAPQVDAITVAGSAVQAPVSEQGSSIAVIPRIELDRRNEASAFDLLRFIPGLTVSQNGPRGSVASAFVRGGNSSFNLVMLDGIPINRFGGEFDLSRIPAEQLERVEVLRGAQSAAHGPYANSGVVNFVTRHGGDEPRLDLLAEGGSHRLRRFAAGGGGSLRGFELSAYASKLETNGEVRNSGFRTDFLSAGIGRRFGRHSLTARGHFNSSENGQPGPWGSNPAGNFAGLDLVSRNKFNWSSYTMQFTSDLSPRFRQEFSGALFFNNNFFLSPFDGSFNNDRRGLAESRSLISVTRAYTVAAGAVFSRERVENTFITDDAFNPFPLRRDHTGVYLENRLELGGRLFVNAGARAEIIHTPRIPANLISGRPDFAANTLTKVNPRVSLAWAPRESTRLRTSLATGIRPPAGFDIAFTNNPALKPERSVSFDAGIERRLWANRAGFETTYFYNRFHDLIVSLGGSLARLSNYRSDNLSNARAQGVEFATRVRPHRSVSINGAYTWLDTEILSLNGASGVAPRYFAVGQPLVRRPRHAASFEATMLWGRVSANVTGYARGRVLEVEPNFGASAGLYYNPGYEWLGINLNVRAARGVWVYGNLRNALDRRYEEIFGYPSPRLNFVTGVKWNFSRE